MLVYLTIEGQERIALGQPPSSWHYTLSAEPREYEGCTDMKIGEMTLNLPSKEACMVPVLAQLKAKEQEIQAEAYKEMMVIKSRRDALLVLTMEPSND